MECVNCTACIDACDQVMEKVDKPKGLIRYASYDSIKEGKHKLFNTRVKAYSVVLLVLVSILSFALFTRSEVETTILKVPGQLFQRQEGGRITNVLNIQFVNKTADAMDMRLEIRGLEAAEISQVGRDEVVVPANELVERIFIISIPESELTGMQTDLMILIYGNGELVEEKPIKFLGPSTLNK